MLNIRVRNYLIWAVTNSVQFAAKCDVDMFDKKNRPAMHTCLCHTYYFSSINMSHSEYVVTHVLQRNSLTFPNCDARSGQHIFLYLLCWREFLGNFTHWTRLCGRECNVIAETNNGKSLAVACGVGKAGEQIFIDEKL